MKKLFFISILFISFTAFSQDDLTASTAKIGVIKLDMNKFSIEELSKKKINIVKKEDEYSYIKQVTINGILYEIDFIESVNEEGNSVGWTVYSVSTKDPHIKTASGARIGSTKAELFKMYENYPALEVFPFYDIDEEQMSKTKSYFILHDYETSAELSFLLENNKVIEIQLYRNEGC